MKNSQLSNDQTVTPAENNSKAIFIRCIANTCKGSVKNTIKRDVSISATVIFKHEIKATAVIIFTWHLVSVWLWDLGSPGGCGLLVKLLIVFYLTITWGAAARTARVAMIVNKVKVIKQSRSRTIAANFQSLSIAVDSSSSRILSVITLISFKIRLSSLGTPEG